MKNNVKIYEAKVHDAEQVAAIGRETFYDTWRAVNTEEDMQQYIKKAFSNETILADIENNQNTFLLAAAAGHLAGYAKLRRDRTYDEFNGQKVIEIERIYVRKEYQHLGFGRALMDACIAIAKNENHAWLWLGVNTDNHPAIEFYKRYDFTIFGKKQFRLGDATDDDYLMKKNLDLPD